ncbi:hypothetical protein PENDEC_c032G04183 [Penicillium decumbens]|uniref:Uncharacterized protein n=1 Tax=Penicillium decumbens TaxID=69771 RepID=A0A1V6NVQ3_PENDC|nr:hypothetical protein PENDEC_c032G04183 [Penicillium decumbens]
MSPSSHRVRSPEQASAKEVLDEEMNERLIPIKVSAKNATTAVGLYTELQSILEIKSHTDYPDLLVITDISPHLATALWQRLERLESRSTRLSYDSTTKSFLIKMPTPIHNSVSLWLHRVLTECLLNGIFNAVEMKLIGPGADDTINLPNGIFANTKKQPDAQLLVEGLMYPTVCLEIGWSESQVHLESDMNRLLIGGQGEINVVILLKWYKRKAGVGGQIQVWRLDAAGVPRRDQEEIVFPAPALPQAPLRLTRQELFGASIVPGRLPTDVIPFSLDDLRTVARQALWRQGLVPL